MAPEHTPVATRFFPAARLGLAVGVAVAIVGAALWKQQQPVGLPHGTPPAPLGPVVDTVALPTAVGAARPTHVELPLVGPIVAHVWLENCADCMSAFEAHARLRASGALADIPQVNVAYGSSTPAFAARYRVDENLIVDADGSKVVRPFGIGSFTTLVIDSHGALVHRDRPDQDGYVERVREAWARARP